MSQSNSSIRITRDIHRRAKLSVSFLLALWLGAASASEPSVPVTLDATNLRQGQFTYQLSVKGKLIGTTVIEIRQHTPAEFHIRFDSKDVQQSWSSTFTKGFEPIAAELHMPGRKEPYHMTLRYSASAVSGEETRGTQTAPVSAAISRQVIDQRVDWAAMMATEFTGNAASFDVYDPGTGLSRLTATKLPAKAMDGVLGRQRAIDLHYTIQKKDHAESYVVYATASAPRVMLREDMPGDLVAELIAVAD